MKILFCGPLLDFSGFATASRNFLHSLIVNSKNIEIVARIISYDSLDRGQKFNKPEWLNLALSKDIQNVDICIQMTTCNIEAQPVPGIFNILYTFLESDRIQASWVQKANEFDVLMVPCNYNSDAMYRSGVTKTILVCPPPCDIDIYNKDYPKFEIKNSSGRTIFYNICQLSTKKGIDILLRAYYAAFADCPDEVLLVLKTYINMQNRSNDKEIIKNFIQSIKNGCRIPTQKLPPVLPITETLEEEQIHSLHKTCDIYVNPSRAEGYCIPAFDSLAHGNSLITSDRTGMEIFVRKDNSFICNTIRSFFFDAKHSDPALYTGVEQCYECSPVEIAYFMRKIHNLKKKNPNLNEEEKKEWDAIQQRKDNAKKSLKSFDYRETSNKIINSIIDIYEKNIN